MPRYFDLMYTLNNAGAATKSLSVRSIARKYRPGQPSGRALLKLEEASIHGRTHTIRSLLASLHLIYYPFCTHDRMLNRVPAPHFLDIHFNIPPWYVHILRHI